MTESQPLGMWGQLVQRAQAKPPSRIKRGYRKLGTNKTVITISIDPDLLDRVDRQAPPDKHAPGGGRSAWISGAIEEALERARQ